MPKIEKNFDSIPSEIRPVKAGTYQCLIETEPETKENKKGTGENLVVVLTVQSDDPECNDRKVFDYISLEKMETKLKRLFLSAGVAVGPEGADTADLVGRTVTARITVRTFKDDESGEERESNNVAGYVIG